MKGTVNPFEPWRPVEARIPPPLHASRPWRPPPPRPTRAAVEEIPSVEPVAPPPRKRPKPPQGQGGQQSRRRTPISPLTALVVLVVIGFLLLNGIGWCLGMHGSRSMISEASAAMFVGMAFNSRCSSAKRLRILAIALALAAIALWFLPTLHGVSLWSAYTHVAELRTLPPGDVAAYQRGAATRQRIIEEFPSYRADVIAAEQSWFRRTADEAIESADREAKKDPNAALAHLQQLDKGLAPLPHYDLVRKDLESARRRVLQSCLRIALQR